ncbi:MAG: head-tail connector protein [Gammaproteobacteria bacterium]|nr:head-tail connector protein [Gammaproteobacteria bacterium]
MDTSDKAVKLLKRFEALKSKRMTEVETIWKDAYSFTYPFRGTQLFTGNNSIGTASSLASTQQADLMDTTGTDSVRILASALMSALTPANSQWFEQEVHNADDVAKRWLDETAKTLWKNIHASNYDSEGYEAMVDECCAGMFALYIDEQKDGGFLFDHWPISQCFLQASVKGGPIDTVFREYTMSAESAVKTYGDNVSDAVKQKATATPDAQIEFVWSIYPRAKDDQAPPFAKGLPIASCHLEKTSKRIVRESGYWEMPVIVPRWMTLPDSDYAVGPVTEALPDLKTLNEIIRLQLMGMDISVAGMWIAKDDGVLNPRTVKVGPRKIIVAADTDSMKPLISSADTSKSLMEIERLQKAIRRVLMADQLTPADGPQMTATEVHVRVELIRQLLGPVYGRMQSEFLEPMVTRCFGLAFRAGAFAPPPDSIRGQTWRVKYVSPLARAQRLVEVQAMDRFENTLIAISQAKPQVMDNYDWDEAARMKAEALGVPQKLLVDIAQRDAARDAHRQGLAQAQQQQQIMAAGQSPTVMGAAAATMPKVA